MSRLFCHRLVVVASVLVSVAASAQRLPSPKSFLGFEPCADYQLANYRQLSDYWRALDKASDRVSLVNIGKTEEGRDQLMLVVSDPSNLKSLERYRNASERLAKAKEFKDDEEARALAGKSKAVVWIDGGLHASEVLCAQHLFEISWQLASRNDDENKRILKDCIILLVQANPDGMDLCSDWYMRKAVPEQRSLAGVPVLYEKYAGHDNNRDFYACNLKETQNMNRVLYEQWFPQIVYNHHQSAPQGTVMFVPPFRTPYNFNVDPLVQISTDLVGIHIHQRLIGEGKGGTVMRNGASYSTWWNGGLRTTTYFHNMVGILTETFGSPNPTKIPFIKDRQIPSTDLPDPVEPGEWHLSQSLGYEVSANYAVLNYASRYREKVLYDMYRAGKNSIERGSQDNWTHLPSRINELGQEAVTKPELRDARLYVLSADQPDKGSLRWFIERLLRNGIEVWSLPTRQTVGGTSYAPGSYVVRCDQAFRPHILDMFEPQDHPNDFQYPGGPPIAPYDSAGYTLAYQMGVEFDRVLEDASLSNLQKVTLSTLGQGALSQGFDLRDVDSYRRLNDALNGTAKQREAASKALYGDLGKPEPARPRVALWDRYGGSIESGWTRFVLDKFDFDTTVVFPPDLDRGDWQSKFDVLILPDGAVSLGRTSGAANSLATDETIPQLMRDRIGSITAEKTVPQMREFVKAGGHIVAIGSSALSLARAFDWPLESALVENTDTGVTRPIPSTKFYVPASVLQVRLEKCDLTQGLGEHLDMMFDNSPAFRWKPETTVVGATVVARYDTDRPLRSGWAWGQELLKGTFAVVDIPVGKGRVVLIGPEALFRGQPSQSFKLVFNAIFRSGARGS